MSYKDELEAVGLKPLKMRYEKVRLQKDAAGTVGRWIRFKMKPATTGLALRSFLSSLSVVHSEVYLPTYHVICFCPGACQKLQMGVNGI